MPGALREEERDAFRVLLGQLEERYLDEPHADDTDAARAFADALGAYRVSYPPADPRDDEAEAIARFARPLLDEASLDDLDSFERALDLANALWSAAHADPAERPALLDAIRTDFGEADPQALLDRLMRTA